MEWGARTVFPDIIVHQRGPGGPNLVVLEMKKVSCGQFRIERDKEKVRAYLNDKQLRYQHGVFLVIHTGASATFGEVERVL